MVVRLVDIIVKSCECVNLGMYGWIVRGVLIILINIEVVVFIDLIFDVFEMICKNLLIYLMKSGMILRW